MLTAITPKITGLGDMLLLSGNKVPLIEKLKLVVEAEDAAREADAAAAQAVAQASQESSRHQRAGRKPIENLRQPSCVPCVHASVRAYNDMHCHS